MAHNSSKSARPFTTLNAKMCRGNVASRAPDQNSTIFGSTPAAPSNDATKASQESRILWSAWDGRCTIATTFGSFSKVAKGELSLAGLAPMLA